MERKGRVNCCEDAITTLGDLAVRVRGCHFLFSSVHPAQLPQRQTATATMESNRKQRPRTLTERSTSMAITKGPTGQRTRADGQGGKAGRFLET